MIAFHLAEPTFDDYTAVISRVDATVGNSVSFDCRGKSLVSGKLDLDFKRLPNYLGWLSLGE